MTEWIFILILSVYIVGAPAAGILLAGADRKLSARMQGRKGPPILQPYYDVRKLLEKERVSVNKVQGMYIGCFLLFTVISGCIMFAGGDILMSLFTLTLGNVFLVLAAYSSGSPYSQIGAEREIYQVMAYEPMVLLTAIGFYLATGSYDVSDIAVNGTMPIIYLAGIFIGFLFVLTIKFRKSPFDLSMSHHAHQDLVRGLTTEFSGRSLAMVEIAHWYENILLLGFVFLFFSDGTYFGYIIGIAAAVAAFFMETLIDNSFARMKWQAALKTSWIIAAVLGISNILILFIIS
jgi:ech hydrogenase subunit B